jgi:hypothetical protein
MTETEGKKCSDVVVSFNSTPDNWAKEKSGVKNNTFRRESRYGDDSRFRILQSWTQNKDYGMIRIRNRSNNETFERRVKDVTFLDDGVIITWEIESAQKSDLLANVLEIVDDWYCENLEKLTWGSDIPLSTLITKLKKRVEAIEMTETEGKKNIPCPCGKGIISEDNMREADKMWNEWMNQAKSDLLAKVLAITLRHISHECKCWRIHECASVINVEIQDLDKKRISEEMK